MIHAGQPDAFRVEAAKKTSAYQSIWMYVIWEMQVHFCFLSRRRVHCAGMGVPALEMTASPRGKKPPASKKKGTIFFFLGGRRPHVE